MRQVECRGPSRVRLGAVGRLQAGEGCAIDLGDRSIALFNVDGRYVALDNRCLHRGGPLGEGALHGRVVTCPWHGWQWDVPTGLNTNNPALRVSRFPVVVENGEIFVDLTRVITTQEDGVQS